MSGKRANRGMFLRRVYVWSEEGQSEPGEAK